MIWEAEDWLLQKGVFDFRKGLTIIRGPLPLSIFVSESKEGFGEVQESRNELLIEVAESDEGSDLFDVFKVSPVFDGVEFDWIHFYGTQGNEKAEVFDFGGVEGAFSEFQGKFLLTKTLEDL